ncbi:MAG: CvpA family protein [Betaproteobacteria bacterium]|nr:CvpA family protein [Betaproteobacteria bacterium]MSQ88209.1 CvpA family protein [Betaproteobacteria bacterium]
MTWLDYAVIGVFAMSLVVGAWRGLVREVLSILGWVIAFLAANLLAGPLGPMMPQTIPSPELRVAAAYLAVFVASLLVTSLVGLLLSRIVKAAGLGGVDRMLGALFGVARGLLIVLAAALCAGLTSAPQQAFWRDSLSAPLLVQAAEALMPLLPQTFAERLRYS